MRKRLYRYYPTPSGYPASARELGLSGRVYVSFIVDEDGNVVNPRVVRGLEKSLDMEALRFIKIMPRWKPATLGGKPVKILYRIPNNFVLK